MPQDSRKADAATLSLRFSEKEFQPGNALRAVRSNRHESRYTRAARRSASLAAKAASLRAFSSWPRTSHRGRSASATQRACPACWPFGQYTSGLLARACSCPCS